MPSDLIVLTRREGDNQNLATALQALGLSTLSYPCIATRTIEPTEERLWELTEAGPVDAIAFPSRAAVRGLYEQPGLLAELLGGGAPLLATVGPATTKILTARHQSPELQAEPATGAALAEALARRLGPGATVLIPGGDKPRPDLPEALTAHGLIPLPLQVYAHEDLEPDPLPAPPPAAILCASPSAAQTFLKANPTLNHAPFVAIGHTTESALKDLGAINITRATATTQDALVEAVTQALENAPPARLT